MRHYEDEDENEDLDVYSVPHRVVDQIGRIELEDALRRARIAGAGEDMEYVGSGSNAIVFRGGDTAYKVARLSTSRSAKSEKARRKFLRTEADWLAAAAETPLASRVATFYEFHEIPIVLEREYVDGVPPYGISGPMAAINEALDEELWNDFRPPELKADSYIVARRGPVVLDPGFTVRRGETLVRYLTDVMDGEIDDVLDKSFAALEINQEVDAGRLDAKTAADVLKRLKSIDRLS